MAAMLFPSNAKRPIPFDIGRFCRYVLTGYISAIWTLLNFIRQVNHPSLTDRCPSCLEGQSRSHQRG